MTDGCSPLALNDPGRIPGPGSKRQAKPAKQRVRRRDNPDAEANVRTALQPGDVITLAQWAPWWQLWWRIPYAVIRYNQKVIFGAQSNWYDTHCMLYLDPDHTVSVEYPVNRWRTPADYCTERITIWRFTKHKPFENDEITAMQEYAEAHLIGRRYNIGELLDIRINTILGFRNLIHWLIFPVSIDRTVCSVGVRLLLDGLGEKLRQCGRKGFDSLFRKVNPQAPWPGGVFLQSKDPNQYGVDLRVTSPGHFANSNYFDNEFELVAIFDQGWTVFP